MKKFLLTIGFLFALAIAAQAQSGCVELREIDGTPDVKCVKIIRVTNGTLSCTGTTCTITISGGGGGSPGGSDTQLQYNNSGSFGGITGATTNGTVVTLTNALATTAFSPSSNDGAALGSGTASFSDLFLASGALINFANGNAVITHSSGIITVSTGDLRVTTAGTNTASAVTVGGTQTLTNKTLASPSVTGNISAEATSLLFFGGNYYRYINGTGPATYDVTTDMVLTFNVQSLTDNRTVTWPDTALTVAGVNVANSWSAGVKQTFAPNGTTAGINVGSVAGDPSAPANGDLWYDSTANELTARINGANVALGSGGGGSPPFADNTALVMNNADNTKRIQFSAASISASTTRVITAPDTNGTLVYEANTATLTNKTLSNVVLSGDTTVSGDAIFGPGTRIGTEASSTNTLLMSAYDVDGGVYVDFLRFTADNTPTLEVLQSLSWADGVRQTFNPNGTNAGLNVGSQAGAPISLSNGDIWYDSTANKFKCRENGSTVDCIGSGGGGGLGDPGANGIVVRTALNTTTARTLTAGSSAGLTVTNGDGVSGNPTVDFATVNTSGLGFNLPGQGGTVFTYDSSSALVGSANEVRVVLFYAPMQITVDRVALNGATDSASNKAGVGIYSANGNTKICDSGAISTTSWSGAANYALSSSCTFGPGFYYYAWTADSTTPTVRSAGSITNYYNPLNNGSGTVLGTAANASSGGVLPSTLGALTDSAGLAVPIVRFYKN